MSKLSPRAFALVVLALPAAAQLPIPNRAHSISAPIRHAGTLHVSDGTWTRKAGTAALGPDVLYDNTCLGTYFSPLSGDQYVDEGRVPGTSSPDNGDSKPGCATSYSIDGFQLAYCTDQASASFTYSFFDNYTPCATTVGLVPVGTFALTGLPGTTGASTCWTVNVDATATPFVLGAGATNPRFGFSMSSPQTSFGHGPIIAGDVNACARWDGTSWDPVLNLAEAGTGMGTQDLFRIELGPTVSGCYFFNGNPYAAFWLELYGTTCAPSAPGQDVFCAAGDFGTFPCPCGNTPPAGSGVGCLHSQGLGARLAATGTARLTNDTLVLVGTQMPANAPALYFQGSQQQASGVGIAFGDGLRCAGGQVTRLGIAINSGSGASQYPQGAQTSVSVRAGLTQPGARSYQIWYRNVAAFCTPAGFNTSNGLEIAWDV